MLLAGHVFWPQTKFMRRRLGFALSFFIVRARVVFLPQAEVNNGSYCPAPSTSCATPRDFSRSKTAREQIVFSFGNKRTPLEISVV